MGMCGICWFDGRALTDEIYDLRKRVEEAEAKLRIHHEIHHEAVQREGGQNPVVTPTKPPAYRGINANYETYDEKRAMTEKKRFNAWEHYRKVRTDLYGAGWEDVDEAANHEHIEALEAPKEDQ